MALRAASLLAVLLFAAGGCETHKAGAETGGQAAADTTKADNGQKAAAPPAENKAPPTKVADRDEPPPPPSEVTPPKAPADDVAPGDKTACAQVIDHVIQLQLTQVPDAQRAQVQKVLPQIRAQGIMECDAKWNAAARRCLLDAKSPKALAPCQALLAQGPGASKHDPEPPPPAETNHSTAPTPGAPTPAAPTADRGPDCARVARNVTAILEKTFGDRAGKHESNVTAFQAECHGWTPKVRQCFLAASNINEAKECSRVQRIDRMH